MQFRIIYCVYKEPWPACRFTVEALSEVPGLRPVSPQGAMYVMVALDVEQFDGIKDDLTFSQVALPYQYLGTRASN